MTIARELEIHAAEELAHALIISKQVDYLGGSPTVTPKLVKMSKKPEDLLKFDLQNETDTIRAYQERECASARCWVSSRWQSTSGRSSSRSRSIRSTLLPALGEEVPDMSS